MNAMNAVSTINNELWIDCLNHVQKIEHSFLSTEDSNLQEIVINLKDDEDL